MPHTRPEHTPLRRELAPVTIDQGLAGAAGSGASKTTNGRSVAPIPAGDEFGFSDSPVPVEDEPTPVFATENQRRLMFAKVTAAGLDKEWLRPVLVELTGQDSTGAIPIGKVDAILEAIDKAAAAV